MPEALLATIPAQVALACISTCTRVAQMDLVVMQTSGPDYSMFKWWSHHRFRLLTRSTRSSSRQTRNIANIPAIVSTITIVIPIGMATPPLRFA
jgi:hypothetical protein